MFEDKVNRMKELGRKNTIGVIICLISIFLAFAVPVYLIQYSTILNSVENPSFYIMGVFGLFVVITIIANIKLCNPYTKVVVELRDEVKKYTLTNELNNAFNSSYREEDIQSYKESIIDLKIAGTSNIRIDDCFSAKYSNIKFKYADVYIYHSNDDSTIIDFKGPIIEFDIDKQFEGSLYIGTKKKSLFSSISTISFASRDKNIVDIIPENNILNEYVALKSDTKPSIVDDPSFQRALNDLISDNDDDPFTNNILIYKNNKLYVLIFNYENSFQIYIDTKHTIASAEEKIRNDVTELKERLDTIMKYKKELGIKENTF